MPVEIPRLSEAFIQNIRGYSLTEIAYELCSTLLQGAIPVDDLHRLINDSMTFPAPIVQVSDDVYSLELWHGPTLAFKDFGARFMAQLMAYFNQKNDTELVILVATSGDTGGAVASGFHKTEGTKVVILYPSGKVSPLQEKQLTTLGDNILALEINGTFDDCQDLVKQAFLDAELNAKIRLTSANSINIARLIPQMFYYFEAYKQLPHHEKELVFVVPSGNFGNLTAGLLAKRMGLPVSKFIAATNANDVVAQYLENGVYNPRPSVRTLSNAMDVGAPSNFVRMTDLYENDWNEIKKDIIGYTFTDEETRAAMQTCYTKTGYILDPHGAVAYLAVKDYQKTHDCTAIFLETAHPAKFLEDTESILNQKIKIPARLADLANKEKVADFLQTDFKSFKNWLLEYL
ncbi:MAG: hypothetical protein RI894_198 [Bacteroidota bacterium]